MSETNDTDKSIGAAPPKATLHLKRPVEQGTVRQSFSHGRSKAVVVEKVKRPILTRARPPPVNAPPRPAPAARRRRLRPWFPARRGPPRSRPSSRRLRRRPNRGCPPHPDGRAARSAQPGAVDDRAQEEEDRRRQGAETEARRGREARDRLEREAAEARKRDEELRRAQEADFKRQSEDEARRRLSGGEPAPSPSIPRAAPTAPGVGLRERSRAPLAKKKRRGASPGVPRSCCPRRRSWSRLLGRPAAASSATVAG